MNDEIIQKLSLIIERNENLNQSVYTSMFPLHPFTTLAISKLFSKYFQNNRSIYSFLFSNEPYSFKEFINKENKEISFYSLSKLYDYMFYLSRAYDIKIPDRETWLLSDEYINKYNFSNIEIDIIKVISLVQSYKMESDIKLHLSNITFALSGEYSEANINDTLINLIKKNLIFKNPHNEYALLDESNINIHKELENEKLALTNINHIVLINKLISKDELLARKFFVKYGNTKFFTKKFVENLNDDYKYKILYFRSTLNDNMLKESVNYNAIFIPINNEKEIFNNLKEVEALYTIKQKFKMKLTLKTSNILNNMIEEKEFFIKSFFKFNNTSKAFYNGKEIIINSKVIQQLITEIFTKEFKDSPIINNYTFNHSSKTNVGILRKLFIAMLANPNEEFFGIKKFPAEKALYISVIKPSGIHKKVDKNWILSEPKELNFNKIWLFLKEKLKNRTFISELIDILKKEPYGLNENSSLLIITLFIVVNKNNTFIFRENTYKYSLDSDVLINITRAPHKFELRYIELSKSEEKLFEIYLKITNDFKNTEYTRNSVKDIISKLYGNFNVLPDYARNTQKISEKAIKLRNALLISKTPYEGLFKLFPKALGYDDIENINENTYIKDFKNSFNEIVSSYKDIMIEIAKHVSSIFKLEVEHYPYNNELKKINEMLLDKPVSFRLKSFLNTFINTDGFKDYINGISIIINEKEIDNSYDNDIINLKRNLDLLSKEFLSSVELSSLSGENKEVRRLKLSIVGKEINSVIIVNNDDLDELDENIKNIKENMPKNLNKDQRLYIISELIKDELNE